MHAVVSGGAGGGARVPVVQGRSAGGERERGDGAPRAEQPGRGGLRVLPRVCVQRRRQRAVDPRARHRQAGGGQAAAAGGISVRGPGPRRQGRRPPPQDAGGHALAATGRGSVGDAAAEGRVRGPPLSASAG